MKVEISLWLALSFGILILAMGTYSAIQRKVRAIVEIGSAVVILLPLLKISIHPLILLPFGTLLFLESLSIMVPMILE